MFGVIQLYHILSYIKYLRIDKRHCPEVLIKRKYFYKNSSIQWRNVLKYGLFHSFNKCSGLLLMGRTVVKGF